MISTLLVSLFAGLISNSSYAQNAHYDGSQEHVDVAISELLNRIQSDPPDVLVVLGSKVIPGRNIRRRVLGTARIYQALTAKPDVIVSGGNAMGPLHPLRETERLCALRRADQEHDARRRHRIEQDAPFNLTEADSMCVQLVQDHGIPIEKIFLEGQASSTVENARFSERIIMSGTYRHALVITTTENETNHAARALHSFRLERQNDNAQTRFKLSGVSWPYEHGPAPWLQIEGSR